VALTRRELLRLGLLSGGVTLLGARTALAKGGKTPAPAPACIDQTMQSIDIFTGSGVGGEAFPTSPFILQPFGQELPGSTFNPYPALRPGYRRPDGTLAPAGASDAWTVRTSAFGKNIVVKPGPGAGQQDAMGRRPRTAGAGGPAVPDAGTHQLWTDGSGVSAVSGLGFPLPNPLLYHIRLQVRTHSVTNSPVQPIDAFGNPVAPPRGVQKTSGNYFLPASTIYGFNGTFPGPRVNSMYGQPCVVRFENDLDMNPLCVDRQDFGAPDWAFLTHLHNGHTAPESDGQPHHLTDNDGGYLPAQWVDNLYLNWPAGGDDREKQSFFWFHDHRMHHTGPNVYKGMVGLFPIYDPKLDSGDERTGLRLPGIKTDNGDGTFDVKYDIPMALYDYAVDDGATPHQDFHNGTGELHPEWWGKSFFRHYPNHGFVGDIFTVNGVAYPTLHVYRRRYRLRFLDASVSRIYQLWLMSSVGGPKAAPGTKGQWQLPDGQVSMQWTQIAAEGGLLPNPIVRRSFELWPAKRREFVVDFSKYADGSPTSTNDVIYLVNTSDMPTGREPNNFPSDPNFPGSYKVPMVKIIIVGNPPEADNSVDPLNLPTQIDPLTGKPYKLRAPQPVPSSLSGLTQRTFTLERGSPANFLSAASQETEWVINSLQFDPLHPLALTNKGVPELWTLANGGGGWVHPMHIHMEEHTVLSRNKVAAPDALHPDDTGKEDVVALYPSESVQMYRNFRTFRGNYVAHCHNLAHEDHNMMFGWSII
jgi:FtsP/CotA-like multicopper oxidase with cupredoxin domain